MAIITLTTDFGTADGYVGAMKGVIATRAPAAKVIDLAHDLPRGDIAHAAWVVATSTRWFPPDTIHVVVIDPGVGSARRPVVLRVPAGRGEHFYVGPDNGVFGYLAPLVAHAIENPAVMADAVSATFHGRDVFATAASELALSRAAGYVGPSVTLSGALPWGPRPAGEGRVIHIDHYGNLITDLPAADAPERIEIVGTQLALVRTYADVASGELLAYVGSAGTIEIAVRDGRADERLRVKRGERVAPAGELTGPYR
jgi:S-adenosylmethionine hydrolase